MAIEESKCGGDRENVQEGAEQDRLDSTGVGSAADSTVGESAQEEAVQKRRLRQAQAWVETATPARRTETRSSRTWVLRGVLLCIGIGIASCISKLLEIIMSEARFLATSAFLHFYLKLLLEDPLINHSTETTLSC